jgi:ATP-dependent Lon protease
MTIAPETPPLSDDELAELPVFPLPNAVLFPGVSMGLHVFEPRYRAMMRHCIDEGPRAMAIAMLKPGFEPDYERQPPIFDVAGAGRIVAHRGNADGTFDLVLEGTQRVRLHELPFVPPFRRARAETLPDVNDDESKLRTVLLAFGITEEALAKLPRPMAEPIAQAKPGTAARMLDLAIDQIVRDPTTRQRLLETRDVGERIAQFVEWERLATNRARNRAMN